MLTDAGAAGEILVRTDVPASETSQGAGGNDTASGTIDPQRDVSPDTDRLERSDEEGRESQVKAFDSDDKQRESRSKALDSDDQQRESKSKAFDSDDQQRESWIKALDSDDQQRESQVKAFESDDQQRESWSKALDSDDQQRESKSKAFGCDQHENEVLSDEVQADIQTERLVKVAGKQPETMEEDIHDDDAESRDLGNEKHEAANVDDDGGTVCEVVKGPAGYRDGLDLQAEVTYSVEERVLGGDEADSAMDLDEWVVVDTHPANDTSQDYPHGGSIPPEEVNSAEDEIHVGQEQEVQVGKDKVDDIQAAEEETEISDGGHHGVSVPAEEVSADEKQVVGGTEQETVVVKVSAEHVNDRTSDDQHDGISPLPPVKEVIVDAQWADEQQQQQPSVAGSTVCMAGSQSDSHPVAMSTTEQRLTAPVTSERNGDDTVLRQHDDDVPVANGLSVKAAAVVKLPSDDRINGADKSATTDSDSRPVIQPKPLEPPSPGGELFLSFIGITE